MVLDIEDTIVACATPASAGGSSGSRAILRLAGPRAHDAVFALLAPPLSPLPWGKGIFAGTVCISDWNVSVPVQIVHWPAGRSSTNQPMAEIHLPCSEPILSAVQSALRQAGVRLARPGEFTLRSFLARKMDLAQAEGVLGLIHAEDADTLKQAIDHRAGGLGERIKKCQSRLLDLLADIEAGLDFVEEDISFLTDEQIDEELSTAAQSVEQMIALFASRDAGAGLPRVVLVGPANAGKSTLFNRLAGEARALVSPLPGTTRDWLSVPMEHAGRRFNLIDTAGFEPTSKPFQSESSAARQSVLRSASLVLWCQPTDQPHLEPAWPVDHVVWTKCDLKPAPTEAEGWAVSDSDPATWDRLASGIVRSLEAKKGDAAANVFSPRIAGSLAQARDSLSTAQSAHRADVGQEVLAVLLREIISHLGEVVGTVYTDDLLDRVFSRFCIGK